MAFWYDGDLFEDEAVAANGEVLENTRRSVPLDNVGLRFGATVFTTVRVYGHDLHHPLTQWQGHCDRLKRSFQKFGWFAPDWSAIYKGCEQLTQDYSILRVTLFPDGREWITGRQLPDRLVAHQTQGVTCWVAPADYARTLPTHKTGNYLACWLAREQAKKKGAHEAILTNPQGEWLETSTGNLWGWANGKWWTPRNNQCLPGLMQRQLKAALEDSGQRLGCLPWPKLQQMDFEAIAYSNCAVELIPIHTVIAEDKQLTYDPFHPELKSLQQRVSQVAVDA